jgi:uncharacterized protein
MATSGKRTNPQQPRLESLTREECLEHLERAVVGRIGYVVEGVAIILPVNFTVLGGSIVFCTAKGSKLSWLSHHSRVAFEVDESRPSDRTGWSVLIRGSAQEVTDPDELDALRRGPLRSWVHPSTEHWVRISIDEISGRALRGSDTGDDS